MTAQISKSCAAVLGLTLAMILAACQAKTPEEKAVHPMLAGHWRLASSKEDCSGATLRFDHKRMVQSSRGREINVLDVWSMEIQGSSVEIEFSPSTRMKLEARTAAKIDELSQTTLTLTLMVSGDSISLWDVQIRDPNKGLQSPVGSKRASIQKMFELRRCRSATGV